MKGKDTQNELRRYLLGQIASDEKRLPIEARLLTEEDYFEECQAVEEELYQEYADDKMDSSERKEFESRFLQGAEGRRKLEFARNLRKAIDKKDTSKEIKETQKKLSFFEGLAAFFKAPALAFASLLVLLGIAGFFGWRYFYKTQDESLAALNKALPECTLDSRISGLDCSPRRITRGAGDDEKVNKIELKKAESLALQGISSESPSAESLHALGRVQLARKILEDTKDEKGAISLLEKAAKLKPDDARIRSDLGVAYMEKAKILKERKDEKEVPLEFFAKALEETSKAIELDGNFLEARFNRASCLSYMYVPNQAKEAWEEYLRLDPDSKWAEEGRKKLEEVEANKPISKTKEQVLQEFLDAKAAGDDERAWVVLRLTRETFSGRLIPQQLTYAYLDAKSEKRETEALANLELLSYVADLEKRHSGDRFWADIYQFYREANPKDVPEIAEAKTLIKRFYAERDNLGPSESINVLSKARSILLKHRSPEVYYCDYWIGVGLYETNKVAESNDILLSLVNLTKQKDYYWMGTQACVRLGWGFDAIGERSKAIEYGEKGLVWAEKTKDAQSWSRLFSMLSGMYQRMARFEDAVRYSEKALILSQMPEASESQKWIDYEAIATALHWKRLNEAASAYQLEALKHTQLIKDIYFEQLSHTYLGIIYTAKRDFTRAEGFFRSAMEVVKNIPDEEVRAKDSAYTLLSYAHLKRISGNCDEAVKLYNEAATFNSSSEYQVENFDNTKGQILCSISKGDHERVDKELPKALALFNESRRKIREEQNRNTFADYEQDIYDIAISYEFSRGNFEKAYDYLEESKARSLYDLMTLPTDVSENHIKFSDSSSPDLKTLRQAQSELPEGIQVIEYALLKDSLLVWVITKDSFSINNIEIDVDSIDKKVSSYLSVLKNSREIRDKDFFTASTELYNVLVLPIEDKLNPNRRLFVVPDKSLFQVPFAALVSSKNSKYLIEDYELSYAPSLNTLLVAAEKLRDRKGISNESLLAIGNPSFDKGMYPELENLSAAEKEVSSIAKFYKNSKVFTDKQATKSAISSDFAKFDVVHYAGHYVIDDRSPLKSGFAVTGQGKDSLLANYELLQKKELGARLVVLSACDTALESYYRGEGMIGAARTMLAIGAPSVIASQWKINSEETKTLMIDFHRYRKSGGEMSDAACLRRAQLDMLTKKGPYYWAGFAAYGGAN